MKKTIITLLALAGVAMGDVTLLDMDFTKLTGNSGDENENLPSGWYAAQWNYNRETQTEHQHVPHYNFGENGAVVGQSWKQNYLTTNLDIASQGEYTITFTLYNSDENTGNMFYLSSDTYSIVMGNSYTSNSDIYVGSLNEAVGRDFVCFQPGTKINPTVLDNSTDLDVSGNIAYTLTMRGGNMTINATVGNSATWSTTITDLEDVTFNKIGFANDGAPNTAGVKGITITTPGTPNIPEPATATLSLLALAGLAARRRRR